MQPVRRKRRQVSSDVGRRGDLAEIDSSLAVEVTAERNKMSIRFLHHS
jgi:hypothetical protein